jgi:hypothetical protein
VAAQASNGAPSSEHSNVDPASFAENVKLADFSRVSCAGPESMLVSGGVLSIDQVKLAGVSSVLSRRSVARTSNVYVPVLSSVKFWGLVQGANPDGSSRYSRHSKRSSASGVVSSAAEKTNLALLLRVNSGGCSSIVV